MATPTRKAKPSKASPVSGTPSQSAQAPAHNTWLASLDALAKAQADGSKAFEAMVKQGMEMQAQTQTLAKEQWQEATERMGAMATAAPGAGWDRLGGIFESRVARALASMGMPSATEVSDLKARVAALEKTVAQLAGTPSRAPAGSKPRRTSR